MKKNILLGVIFLGVNLLKAQEKKTYLDSIFYDTINLEKIMINDCKLNTLYTLHKTCIGVPKFESFYREKDFEDGDKSNKEYLKICYNGSNISDCMSGININYIFFIKQDLNKQFKFESLLFNIEKNVSKIKLTYNNSKIDFINLIDIIKIFPNSYNYYIKQKENKFRDRNIGINIVDKKHNQKLFFGIDEEKNIIKSISIDEIW